MDILIATSNPGKLAEIKKGFQEISEDAIHLYSLKDKGIDEKPEETGKTFQENALLKAKFYSTLSGMATIADDGGITIDYLNGEPGVKSRRWPGYEATDEELIEYTLKKLSGVPFEKRTAALHVCLCFFDPSNKKTIYVEEKVLGHLTDKVDIRRIEGYPFRSLFIVDEFNKYYDELTEAEHEKINHRLHATKKIAKEIQKLI